VVAVTSVAAVCCCGHAWCCAVPMLKPPPLWLTDVVAISAGHLWLFFPVAEFAQALALMLPLSLVHCNLIGNLEMSDFSVTCYALWLPLLL